MSKRNATLLISLVASVFAGCGPHVDLVATRSRRIEKDGKLDSVVVESMYMTHGHHGDQLLYEVDVLDSMKRPVMATHRHFRNEKGQVAGSRIVLGEEQSGEPSHVDVEIPVSMLGAGQRELPAYAQVHLMPVNGGPGAETTIELPLAPPDVEGMGGPPAYAAADQTAEKGSEEKPVQGDRYAARDSDERRDPWRNEPEPESNGRWHDRVVPDDASGNADRRDEPGRADRDETATRGGDDAYAAREAGPASTDTSSRDDELTYWTTDRKPLPPRRDTPKASRPTVAPHDDRVQKGDSRRRRNDDGTSRRPPAGPYEAEVAELQSAVLQSPNDIEKQLRLRMLYLAQHREGQALAPIEGTDPATSAKIDEYLAAILPAVRAGRVDPASITMGQLDQWVEQSQSAKQLRISDAAFCRTIDGFGKYRAYDPPVFPSARMPKFLIYLQVENYVSTRARTGVYRTLLSVQQKLLNSAGVEVWSTLDQEIPDLSNGLRKDFFLAIGPVDFQQVLPPDEYTLVISLRDVLGDTSCEKRMHFRVSGP